ncbi:aminotransferase class I/II-fold pyridoxal phosphate-dependent enzyme [Bradyrhizobium sp. SZCCHNS1054]|uniref:aminotransferase class I/II-fold pyridoxal phosphate-dependent enzyme n=1 Tax=Bradyrhizobium sp. SZCCHNS1054 TaxID=3057301 RepID=UPI002916F93A|nr:aminotransferase class I/II-fold pyridoxal phosphate-dependent enzyme [Bradyrhizobium sp. SZCCHNS1054]
MYPLDWTGNHFLDPALVRDLIDRLAKTDWDPTRRTGRNAPDLLEAISQFYEVDPSWIGLVPGSAAGIDAFIRSRPGAPIVDVVPNFHQAHTTARRDLRSYTAVPLALGADVTAAVRPHRGSGAILTMASPSNPFGSQIPMETIAELARDWDGFVLLDEAYADFAPATAMRLLADHPNLFISRTFSKAWGLADLRLGFIVGRSLETTGSQDYLACLGPDRVATWVARELLRHPLPILRSIEATLEMRENMTRRLRELAFLTVIDSDTNYVTVRCSGASAVVGDLRLRGLQVKQLSTLRGWPADWPDGIRASVCPSPLLDQLIAGLAAFDGQ